VNTFDILPLTYVIEEGFSDPEYIKFENEYKAIDAQLNKNDPSYACKNVWIIKPGENTNRGCGIIVSNDLSEIR
jgi:tubulin--tyrosine ligase